MRPVGLGGDLQIRGVEARQRLGVRRVGEPEGEGKVGAQVGRGRG